MRNDSSSEFVSPIRYSRARYSISPPLYKFPILSEPVSTPVLKLKATMEEDGGGWGIYRRNKRAAVQGGGVIGVRGYRGRARERLVRNICTAS